MNRKTAFFAILILSVFALVTAFFIGGLGKDPRALPSVLVGKTLPVFTLPDLAGGQTRSNAELPQEPFLLNVWGSWCPACYVEHPYLMELGETIPIVGLNWPADNKTESTDAPAMLRRHGDPYRLVLVDAQGTMTTDLGVYGAPETFLIAKDGTILHRHAGPIDENIWQKDFAPRLKATP